MKDLQLWLRLFVLRLALAVCTLHAGHPDEFWQFNEPAHLVVFGRGYFTWDWRAGIRSFVFPLPLIAAFLVAKLFGKFGFLGIEDAIVQAAPFLIRAFWCSMADLYTFKLARKYFGPLAGKWALLFTCSSRVQAAIANRSFSNGPETALCAVVAFLWPRNRSEWNRQKWTNALALLGLACLIRISAIQMFLPAAVFLLFYAPNPLEVIGIAVPLIAATVAFGIAVDSFFYGKFTVSWWNFYHWNVVKKVSHYYGVASFDFYISALKREMLGFALPFAIFGLFRSLSKWKAVFPFFMFALPYFIFCSLQPHKEIRFLLPILPFLLGYAAHGGQQVEVWLHKRPRIFKELASLALIAAVVYNSFHFAKSEGMQLSGIPNTLLDLRSRVSKLQASKIPAGPDDPEGIFFLSHCHNFPFYGVFHLDYPMEFISCSPGFAHRLFRKDPENDLKYVLNTLISGKRAKEALETYLLRSKKKRPRFVVTFGDLYLEAAEEFDKLGYEKCGHHTLLTYQKMVYGIDHLHSDAYILCAK